MCKSKLAVVTLPIIVLISGMFSACYTQYPEEKMTADQVINVILVQEVPNLQTQGAYPVGKWGAVYEGEGKWRIRGYLTYKAWSSADTQETIYFGATWIYSNNQTALEKMELLEPINERPVPSSIGNIEWDEP